MAGSEKTRKSHAKSNGFLCYTVVTELDSGLLWLGTSLLVKIMEETDREKMRQQLTQLLEEHRDLDDVIARIHEQAPFDQLQLQRMKKRKLMLKDLILKLESELLPDIIA